MRIIKYNLTGMKKKISIQSRWLIADVPELAQKLDYRDSEFNEQEWANDWNHIIPVKIDDRSDTMKWNFWVIDSDGDDTEVAYVLSLNDIDRLRN